MYVPTTARISPDRPITPKNSSSSWFLSRMISRARSRPKKEREKKKRIFLRWRTISRGGSSYRANQSTGYIFSRSSKKKSEGSGSGTRMHRTGGGTTRNVNSSLIEMPSKDSPFNRDPNDKFLLLRVISCPRISSSRFEGTEG